MSNLEDFLSSRGFDVFAIDYPSTEAPIAVLSREYVQKIIEARCTDRSKKIHFVTHSMGAIILRQIMTSGKIKHIGRTVMLAPPNKGSEAADFFCLYGLARRALGPALCELGTGKNSVPIKLGSVDFETGIIAGKRSLDPFGSFLIPGDDDGRVSVENTMLDRMQDFLVVNCSHSFIMDSSEVMEQCCHFLLYGNFKR